VLGVGVGSVGGSGEGRETVSAGEERLVVRVIETGRRICSGAVTLITNIQVGRVSIVQEHWSGGHHDCRRSPVSRTGEEYVSII